MNRNNRILIITGIFLIAYGFLTFSNLFPEGFPWNSFESPPELLGAMAGAMLGFGIAMFGFAGLFIISVGMVIHLTP